MTRAYTTQSREFPCIDCHDPFTAIRRNTRCAQCGIANKIKTNRVYLRKRRHGIRPKKDRAPDASIQLYRAHKEQSRVIAEYNALMAEAKREYEAMIAPRQPMGKAA